MAAPWPFVPQPDKLGYVNNPRWTTTPASLVDHEPCGYWFKTQTASQALGPFSLYGTGRNTVGQLGLGDLINRNIFTFIMDNVVQVTGSFQHTVVLKSNGSLWATGRNDFGQLGLGFAGSDISVFTEVGTGKSWISVVAGEQFTIALRADGTLWGCGRNSMGELGLGDTVQRNSLTQIGVATDWKLVSVEDSSSGMIAQKSNGTLWGTGTNFYGQLGLGDTTQRNTLTQIGADTDWKDVDAGEFASMAKKSPDRLWGAGDNALSADGGGKLGLGSIPSVTVFTQIGIDNDWKVHTLGKSGKHALAIKNDGTLWATGRNTDGQLGLGTTINKDIFTKVGTEALWQKIATGRFSSFALKPMV